MTPPPTQPHTAPETHVSGAALVSALREWTAANERARREYAEHPLAKSCSRQHQCTAMYLKRAAAVA